MCHLHFTGRWSGPGSHSSLASGTPRTFQWWRTSLTGGLGHPALCPDGEIWRQSCGCASLQHCDCETEMGLVHTRVHVQCAHAPTALTHTRVACTASHGPCMDTNMCTCRYQQHLQAHTEHASKHGPCKLTWDPPLRFLLITGKCLWTWTLSKWVPHAARCQARTGHVEGLHGDQSAVSALILLTVYEGIGQVGRKGHPGPSPEVQGQPR